MSAAQTVRNTTQIAVTHTADIIPARMLSHIWYQKMLKHLDEIRHTTATLHFWHKNPKIISHTTFRTSLWRYPYFDAVVGLVSSDDPESYAGSSIATGRASHCRQVKGDDPEERGNPGPTVWGFREADNLTP
jgi:hypothetical protein